MTSKVVRLRLITWGKLPLMKSDIGWVYITHSKVFIPSSLAYTVQCLVLSSSLCMNNYCLSTQYYHISYVLSVQMDALVAIWSQIHHRRTNPTGDAIPMKIEIHALLNLVLIRSITIWTTLMMFAKQVGGMLYTCIYTDNDIHHILVNNIQNSVLVKA